VAAGAFSQPGGRGGNPFADLPAFCRVAATLKPTADSDIKMECGCRRAGLERQVPHGRQRRLERQRRSQRDRRRLRRGYAAASTDTGHEGGGGPWMANAEKLIDFGYRAVHETTAKAKALVNAYYGNAPRSPTSRAAPPAAARVEVGAEVPRGLRRHRGGRAGAQHHGPRDLRRSTPRRRCARKKAATSLVEVRGHSPRVLEACDAKDGVKDDVLENPRACTWDPKTIECKAGTDDASCLTPAQVVAARALYQPVKNARTGKLIFSGLELGSEMGWSTFGSQQAFRSPRRCSSRWCSRIRRGTTRR
jgi:feruloyl esterase